MKNPPNIYRRQIRQLQKALESWKVKHENMTLHSILYRQQRDELQSKLTEALKLTPAEKAALAYSQQKKMQEVNAKICELGVCIHKEHQKHGET